MGKKMISKILAANKQNEPEQYIDNDDDLVGEEEEEELSDLEAYNDDADQDAESIEEINHVEELNELTANIKVEFAKLMARKGGNPNNWMETMTIVNPKEIDENLNIDDDIKRELYFYNMTNENVIQGIMKLREVRKISITKYNYSIFNIYSKYLPIFRIKPR